MKKPQYNTRVESCSVCGVETVHHVLIDVKTESAEYGGRQPYRVAECQVCGEKTEERIGEGT